MGGGALIGRDRDLEAITAFETAVSFVGLNQFLHPVLGRTRALNAAYRKALDVELGVREGSSPDRLMLSNAALALLRVALARQLAGEPDRCAWHLAQAAIYVSQPAAVAALITRAAAAARGQ